MAGRSSTGWPHASSSRTPHRRRVLPGGVSERPNAGGATHQERQTALFDAVYLAANQIKKSKLNKKAMILVSDGGENHNRYNLSQLQNVCKALCWRV